MYVSNLVKDIIRNEKTNGSDSEKAYIVPFGMGPVDMSKIEEVDQEI